MTAKSVLNSHFISLLARLTFVAHKAFPTIYFMLMIAVADFIEAARVRKKMCHRTHLENYYQTKLQTNRRTRAQRFANNYSSRNVHNGRTNFLTCSRSAHRYLTICETWAQMQNKICAPHNKLNFIFDFRFHGGSTFRRGVVRAYNYCHLCFKTMLHEFHAHNSIISTFGYGTVH